MTSANLSDEPIAYRDDDARERLAGIADTFVTHDRPIHIRTDDSVVRSTALGPVMLRRARGYVPGSLELPVPAAVPITAYGAELKSTICVAKGARAWPSHHLGDLENWETLRSLREAVEHFERVFAVEPVVLAHDLHPEYLSTKEALAREGVERVAVQHHHAHLAACLAEHGRTGPALGVIYDGTGYGTDGTVWGGELLAGGLAGFDRAAHLWPVRMPGGERAIREPWRMACAWLAEIEGGEPALPRALAGRVDPERWRRWPRCAAAARRRRRDHQRGPPVRRRGRAVRRARRGHLRGPGRRRAGGAGARFARARPRTPLPLEDGVLDARASSGRRGGGPGRGHRPGDRGGPLPRRVGPSHRRRGGPSWRTRAACDTVVLSGGVFQNRLLLEQTAAGVRDRGLEVLRPERLPPNDGGIAYGQAAVAAATLTT